MQHKWLFICCWLHHFSPVFMFSQPLATPPIHSARVFVYMNHASNPHILNSQQFYMCTHVSITIFAMLHLILAYLLPSLLRHKVPTH